MLYPGNSSLTDASDQLDVYLLRHLIGDAF